MRIEDLKPTDVARGVVYRPLHGEQEYGTIVRWNDTYIFVLYRNKQAPEATMPEDLEFWPTETAGG